MLEPDQLYYIPLAEIRKVRKWVAGSSVSRMRILADVFRINTLSMIKEAGSGHIGTSFSAMDIVTWLWAEEMNSPNQQFDPDLIVHPPHCDIFFSSKGHDVPGLYSALIGLEKIPYEYIHKLRRLGGLPGHPDVGTPFIATNTGSLGMGISKARGMAYARRQQSVEGRIYVLTGDGELQEGQIWESLGKTANDKYTEITVIVDHNKMQSDTFVKNVNDIGHISQKFRAFGWNTFEVDGHDYETLATVLKEIRESKFCVGRPVAIIAHTTKGKGVSFMEPKPDEEFYKYHAGAPSDEDYYAALTELVGRVNCSLSRHIGPLALDPVSMPPRATSSPKAQNLVSAYGDELVKISEKRKDIVVLDADLVKDCGIAEFKKKFPERFIECGIAEQDMVSMAGGIARQGMLPVVHSFACFLTPRANEQIYNNATEKTKIIYIGTLAGLIPGGPGHSHQSVRDIACMSAMPGLTIIEPSCEDEARMAIRWAVEENRESTYIRFVNVLSELPYELELPKDYKMIKGRGVALSGDENMAAIVAYGPVMLREAVLARRYIYCQYRKRIAVINMPWLNFVDVEWLYEQVGWFDVVFTLDNHYVKGGQGEYIASLFGRLNAPRVVTLGLEEIPACGLNDEVLKHHKLDYKSIADRIMYES